ncbi:MAG: amidohydrolase family protein [Pseudomonadales bacterium]|nr:amidohydrolase family protein [Pseudomonadales bacterium]
MKLDLLIRNGTIVDGSGAPRYRGDVAIAEGRIVELGRISSRADEIIEADGLVVAPGFIDAHTHMDAQVSWDKSGTCSCWHGVTSVIMGNCGFTLAPCRPEEREWFARCLESVEDIPADAMLKGVNWNWETFPEYLQTLEALPKGMNYGAYIGHSALRMYTMGERALEQAHASPAELEQMKQALREAIKAGAIGFSSSRTHTHVTPDGAPVASRVADWSEIDALVDVMADLNTGIFEISAEISNDREARRNYLSQLQSLAVRTGRPVTFGTLTTKGARGRWHKHTDYIEQTIAAGGRMFGQAATRPLSVLFSFNSNMPFDQLPAWRELRSLPRDEQRRRMQDPVVREALIAAEAEMKPKDAIFQGGAASTHDPRKPDYDALWVLQDGDWRDPSVGELARQRNLHPVELMLDLVLETDFKQFFLQPIANDVPEDVLGLLRSPHTLATFSDSGAHVGQEIGSSLQSYLLSYWVREQQAFTIEQAVRMLTFDIASAWELPQRGLLRSGYKADLVVFDPDQIAPLTPTVENDLPGGSLRLVQKAKGITATIVNGQVAMRDGEATGNFAGELLKGNYGRLAN